MAGIKRKHNVGYQAQYYPKTGRRKAMGVDGLWQVKSPERQEEDFDWHY